MKKRKSVDLATLSKLPATIRPQVEAIVSQSNFTGMITAADAQQMANQLGWTMQQLMLALVNIAEIYALPTISDFKVGAISMGLTGNLYYGANFEFKGEALPYTTHAEQAATVNAWIHGEQGMQSLAVSAAPCGYCRQFLYEIVNAKQLQILLPDTPAMLLTDLLPDAFGPQDLGVIGGLLAPQSHDLVLYNPSPDPVVQAALQWANMSYAPYTCEIKPNTGNFGYAAIAIGTTDGSVIVGPYGENAAYNPSVSPMESALMYLIFCGYDYSDIQSVVLVQGTPNVCGQEDVSRNVLQTVSSVPLTVAYAYSASQGKPSIAAMAKPR